MAPSSKILRFVNPKWRSRDLEAGVLNAIGMHFDYWRALIASVGRFFSHDGAPDDWLDFLMFLTGHVTNPDLDPLRKRALIRDAFAIWTNKGTEAGIEAYVRALVGENADVVELATDAFIAGWSKAGDVCGPGETGWTFRVDVPAGSITEDELRALLVTVVPDFVTYSVNFT